MHGRLSPLLRFRHGHGRNNRSRAWRRHRPSCRRHPRLPPTVLSDSRYRVWQRRFYPYGVYSEKKRLEKLSYMHNNPVKRGSVHSPEEWPWSSFRFYYLNDSSLLGMDKLVWVPSRLQPQSFALRVKRERQHGVNRRASRASGRAWNSAVRPPCRKAARGLSRNALHFVGAVREPPRSQITRVFAAG